MLTISGKVNLSLYNFLATMEDKMKEEQIKNLEYLVRVTAMKNFGNEYVLMNQALFAQPYDACKFAKNWVKSHSAGKAIVVDTGTDEIWEVYEKNFNNCRIAHNAL